MSAMAARRTTVPVMAVWLREPLGHYTEHFGPQFPGLAAPALAPVLHSTGARSLDRKLMAYQSTLDHATRDTNAFYRRTLHVLSDARVPFLVGGSHAILTYTGIVRETKDFDLFLKHEDLDAALDA